MKRTGAMLQKGNSRFLKQKKTQVSRHVSFFIYRDNQAEEKQVLPVSLKQKKQKFKAVSFSAKNQSSGLKFANSSR